MLTAQFILGLKEELRSQVEMQLPKTVARAAILASIQDKLLEKRKSTKYLANKQSNAGHKPDAKSQFTPSDMWKARQLREHHRVHGLCFKYGDTFAPGHKCAEEITEVQNAQVHVMETQVGDGGSHFRGIVGCLGTQCYSF
jgi:hypothetical protein